MNEIITVGARVKTCFESTAGVMPTSGFVTLANVTEAPEVALSLETIDVSDIQDKITRYVPGRQDPGGEKQFTMNHTDAAINAWNTLVAQAETNKSSGKRLWWEFCYPNAAKSFFFCGTPKQLGNSGIQGNSASTLTGSVVFEEYGGWLAHSQQISASDSTKSVVKANTATVTISNAQGAVKVTSSNPAAATAVESSGTLTITGVDAGTTVITCEDANGDSCQIVVTCTTT